MTTEQFPAPPAPPTHERRIAVLPFAVAGAVLVAGIAGAIAIASLALTPAPQGPLQAVAPPAASPAPTPAPAEPEPLPQAAPNQCVDHVGDAAVDLASVQVQPGRRGSVLAVFELAGPLPDGSASLSLLTEGDRESYRFTAEWDDGDLESFAVFEVDDDDRDKLDRDAVSVNGTTVVMELPAKLVKRLGGQWAWSAFTGAGGLLDDACGDGLVPFTGDRDEGDDDDD